MFQKSILKIIISFLILFLKILNNQGLKYLIIRISQVTTQVFMKMKFCFVMIFASKVKHDTNTSIC
jgi:hypothetical protein